MDITFFSKLARFHNRFISDLDCPSMQRCGHRSCFKTRVLAAEIRSTNPSPIEVFSPTVDMSFRALAGSHKRITGTSDNAVLLVHMLSTIVGNSYPKQILCNGYILVGYSRAILDATPQGESNFLAKSTLQYNVSISFTCPAQTFRYRSVQNKKSIKYMEYNII